MSMNKLHRLKFCLKNLHVGLPKERSFVYN
ncbi:Protein of unknown function [Bacillus mycoides]|nr:Protein of unknown function [Bacillus mycoides]